MIRPCPPSRSTPLARSVLLPCLLLMALTGCGKKAPDPAALAASAPKPAVTVVLVTKRNLATMGSFVGEVRGKQDVEIRARVQGYLEAINFKAGSAVKKGDLLFSIDQKPFQAILAQAKAAQAQAQVEATKYKNDAARYTELAAKGLVPRKQAEDATAQAAASAANVDAARAVVRAKEVDLGYTRVTSPINGIAGLIAPSVGNIVGAPSDPPMTVVSDLTSVTVRFSVAETEYLKIFRERAARAAAGETHKPVAPHLVLADGSIYPLEGKIVSTDSSVDAKTGSLTVEAEFPNPNGLLKPGQFARITGETGSIDDALVIPQRAVTLIQGTPSVYVVGADGVAEQKRIEGEEASGGLYRVKSGLIAGDRVIIEGQMKVRPGVATTVTETDLDKALGIPTTGTATTAAPISN